MTRHCSAETGSLASFGDLIAPYADIVTEGSSVKLFIAHDNLAAFMNATHSVPELTAAMATLFPGAMAHVLWAELQEALDTGVGLLELSSSPAASPESVAVASAPVPEVPDGLAAKLRQRRLAEAAEAEPLAEAFCAATSDTRLQLTRGGSTVHFESFDELWASIDELESPQPVLVEITDMANRWASFSLIGTPSGTAVARYEQSGDQTALRVYGAQVDDLAALSPSDRNGFVVHQADHEIVASYTIPRPHLLTAIDARRSSEALMGMRAWDPDFNDLVPVSA